MSTKKRILSKIFSAVLLSFVFVFALVQNTEVAASTSDVKTEKFGLNIGNTITYELTSIDDWKDSLETFIKNEIENDKDTNGIPDIKEDCGVQVYFQLLYIADYYSAQLKALSDADIDKAEGIVNAAKSDITNYIYDWAVEQAKTELKHAASTLQVNFASYEDEFKAYSEITDNKHNPSVLRDLIEATTKKIVLSLAKDALVNAKMLAEVELIEYATLNALLTADEAKEMVQTIYDNKDLAEEDKKEITNAPDYYTSMVEEFASFKIEVADTEDTTTYIKNVISEYQNVLIDVETELMYAKGDVTLLSAKNDAIKLLGIYASVLKVEMKPEYEDRILNASVDTLEDVTFDVMDSITTDAKNNLEDKIFTEERLQTIELLKMYAKTLGVEFKAIYEEMLYAAGVTADNLRDVVAEIKSFIENDAKDLAYSKVLEEAKKLTVKLLKLYAATAQVEYLDSYTVRIYEQTSVSAVEAESEVIMSEINEIVKAKLEDKVLKETKEASIKIIKLYANTLTVEWKKDYEDRINAATFENLQSVLMGVKAEIDSEAKDVAYNIVLEQTKKYTIKLVVLYTSTLGVEYDKNYTTRINNQTTIGAVEDEFMTIKSEIDAYVASKVISTAKEETIKVLKFVTAAVGLTWDTTYDALIMAAQTVEELEEIAAKIKEDIIAQGKVTTEDAIRTNAIRILKLYASSLHVKWDSSWEQIIAETPVKNIDDAIMTVKGYVDSLVVEMALEIARGEAYDILHMLAEVLDVSWDSKYNEDIDNATSIDDLNKVVLSIKNRFYAQSEQKALDLAHGKTITLLIMYASALHVDWNGDWEEIITNSSLLDLDSAILVVKGYIDEIAISDAVGVAKENAIKVLSLLAETLDIAWSEAYDAKILAAQTKAEVEAIAKEIKNELIANAKNITVSTARKYALQAMNLYASALHVTWNGEWDSIINNSHIEDLDQAMLNVKGLIDAELINNVLDITRNEIKSTIDMLCNVLGVAYDSTWNELIDYAKSVEDLTKIANDIKTEIYTKAYDVTLSTAQDKAYNLLKMYSTTVGITEAQWVEYGWQDDIYGCTEIIKIDEVIYNIISEMNSIVANSALKLAQEKAITVMRLYASTLQVEWKEDYEYKINNSTAETLEDAIAYVKNEIDAAATTMALDFAKENALKSLRLYAKVAGVRDWKDSWTKTINDVNEVKAMPAAIEKVVNEITLAAKENALNTVQTAALAIIKLYADSVNVEIKPEWIDMIKDAVAGDLQSVISRIKELINEEIENRKQQILLETSKKTAVSILTMYYSILDQEVPSELIDEINNCGTPEEVETLLTEFVDDVIIASLLDKTRDAIITGLQVYADTLDVQWNNDWSNRISYATDLEAEIKAVKSEIDALAKQNVVNFILGKAQTLAHEVLSAYAKALNVTWKDSWTQKITDATLENLYDVVKNIKNEIDEVAKKFVIETTKNVLIEIIEKYAKEFNINIDTQYIEDILNAKVEDLVQVAKDIKALIDALINTNSDELILAETKDLAISVLYVYADTLTVARDSNWETRINACGSVGAVKNETLAIKDEIDNAAIEKLYGKGLAKAKDLSLDALHLYAETLRVDDQWDDNWTKLINDSDIYTLKDNVITVKEAIENKALENGLALGDALYLQAKKVLAVKMVEAFANVLEVPVDPTWEERINAATEETLESVVYEILSEIKDYKINELSGNLESTKSAIISLLKQYASLLKVEWNPNWEDIIIDAPAVDLVGKVLEVKEAIDTLAKEVISKLILDNTKKYTKELLKLYAQTLNVEDAYLDSYDADIDACETVGQVKDLALTIKKNIENAAFDKVDDTILTKAKEAAIFLLETYSETLGVSLDKWDPTWVELINNSETLDELKDNTHYVMGEIIKLVDLSSNDLLLGYVKDYAILLLKEYYNTLASLGATWDPTWESEIDACETIGAVKDMVLVIKGEIESSIEPKMVEKAREEAIKLLTSYANTFGQDELTAEQLKIIESAETVMEVYDAVLVVKSMIDTTAKDYAISEINNATLTLLEAYASTFKINLTQEQKDLILNSKSIDEVEKNAITVKNEIDAEVKELLLKEARDAAIKALEEFASIFDIELTEEQRKLIEESELNELEDNVIIVKNEIVESAKDSINDKVNEKLDEIVEDQLRDNSIRLLETYANIVGFPLDSTRLDEIRSATNIDEINELTDKLIEEITEYAEGKVDDKIDDVTKEFKDEVFKQTKTSTLQMLKLYAESIGYPLTPEEIAAIEGTKNSDELTVEVDKIKDRLVKDSEQAKVEAERNAIVEVLKALASVLGIEIAEEDYDAIKHPENYNTTYKDALDNVTTQLKDKMDSAQTEAERSAVADMLDTYAKTLGLTLDPTDLNDIRNAKDDAAYQTALDKVTGQIEAEVKKQQQEAEREAVVKMLESYADILGITLEQTDLDAIKNAENDNDYQEAVDKVTTQLKDEMDNAQTKAERSAVADMLDTYAKTLGITLNQTDLNDIRNATDDAAYQTALDKVTGQIEAEVERQQKEAEREAVIKSLKSYADILDVTTITDDDYEAIRRPEDFNTTYDDAVKNVTDKIKDKMNSAQDDAERNAVADMLDTYAKSIGYTIDADKLDAIRNATDDAAYQTALDDVTTDIKDYTDSKEDDLLKEQEEAMLKQAVAAAYQEIKIYCIEKNVEYNDSFIAGLEDVESIDELEEAIKKAKANIDACIDQLPDGSDEKLVELRESKQKEIVDWLLKEFLPELLAKIESGELVFRAKLSAKQTSVENQLREALSKIYTKENVDLIISYYNETMEYLEIATTEAEINAALLSFQNKVMGLTNAITGTPQGYALDYISIALLTVIAILIIVLIVFVAKKDKQPIIVYGNTSSEPENTVEEEVEEEVQEETEEEVQEEAQEETEEETQEEAEEEAEEEVQEETQEEVVAPVVEEVETTENPELAFAREKRYVKPFKNRILEANELTQEFYSTIKNELCSYRKVRARMSKSCESFRISRDLQAKLVMSSTTLKLYLALNPADFNQKIYFQKDVSHKKKYQDVPLMMRLKSRRSVKRSIDLIGTLMANKQVTKRPRYVERNYIEVLKQQEEQKNQQ